MEQKRSSLKGADIIHIAKHLKVQIKQQQKMKKKLYRNEERQKSFLYIKKLINLFF